MSRWQTLLQEGGAGQYADKLTMAGAVLNRRSTQLHVQLHSEVLLEKEDMQRIFDALNAPFAGEPGELCLEFSFPQESAAFAAAPENFAGYLFGML